MNQQYNDIEDLLVDESFRNWVKDPTPELDSLWTQWLSKNPEKKILCGQAKEVLLTMRFEEFIANEDSKQRILNQVRFETSDWNRKLSNATFFTYWRRIAAILVVSTMLGALIYQFSRSGSDATEIAQIEYIIKENPLGVRSQHTLSDGSKVHLNAGSKIEYPIVFDENQRSIKLSGEAYFEVVSDKLRPFKVEADDIQITVLGTKFNVRSSHSENVVALLEGSVKVSTESQSQLIKPGEEARLTSTNELVIDEFDEKQVFGWTKGKLVFQDASFEEVTDRLKRWYGVEVLVSNSPSDTDWSYTGTFTNESLENVLLNMSVVRSFDYEVSDDSAKIIF